MDGIRKVRMLIREILEEMFDNPVMPKDVEILTGSNYVVYRFKTNKKEYAVSFTKFEKILDIMMPKDEIDIEVIKNSKSIYFLKWGLFDKSRPSDPYDEVDTNAGEAIYVFDSVFAIISDFIKKHDPEIIFYWVRGKRENIYNQITKKIMRDYKFIPGQPNTYLIKNTSYEK